MTDTFTQWRTLSLTRPDYGTGMIEGFPAPAGTVFTKKSLQDFQPSIYAERIKEVRGDNGLHEDYVLQGYSHGEWVTVKPIVLLPGEEPELDFGACADCGAELEESEFALGTICAHCLEREHEAREAATW